MARFLDARIPLSFASPPASPSAQDVDTDSAWLMEGDAAAPAGAAAARFVLPAGERGHAIDCACCVPRGPAAEALAGLFLARARGSVPFFRRVIAVTSEAGEVAIRAALADDPLVSARFRLDPLARSDVP